MILDKLNELVRGFMAARVLTSAVRCGIFDTLCDSPKSIETIASQLKLNSIATGKIIRALCAMGFVYVDGNKYHLNEEIAYLWKSPESPKGMILHNHHLYDRWGAELENWLHNENENSPPIRREIKRTLEENKNFANAMRSNAFFIIPGLLREINCENAKKLLDIGGSIGHLTIPFLKKYPNLKATIVDTVETIQIAKEELSHIAEFSRIDFIAGDYHEVDFGNNFDIVMLSNILHQESKDCALKLIKKAAQVLAPNGKIVVVDFKIDDEKCNDEFGTLFAINMRSFGDVYSFKEIESWMNQAGLDYIKRTDILTNRWIIEGTLA